jgi:putative sugar O-methyltransferase
VCAWTRQRPGCYGPAHEHPTISVKTGIVPLESAAYGSKSVITFARLHRTMSIAGWSFGRPTSTVLARSAEMRDWINQKPTVFRPSRYWDHLSSEDDKVLKQVKVENFKRCLPQHYFNWPVNHPAHPQFAALLRSWLGNPSFTPLLARLRGSARVVLVTDKPDAPREEWLITPEEQRVYTLFVGLLWWHATRVDPDHLEPRLAEPAIGSPIPVYLDDRMISQDVANSLREFRRFQCYLAGARRATLAELGAGYGRLGYLALTASSCRYWVVDIPPALAVAEWYLSRCFPDRRIFRWRPFTSWDSVANEIAQADIAFFTVDQLALFPEKSVDVFASISTIHEMTPDQIEAYMTLQFRATSRAIYTKNWTSWHNHLDQNSFNSTSIVAPEGWRTALDAADDVITDFTEKLFVAADVVDAS